MSGIAGLFNFDGRSATAPDLDTLAAPSRRGAVQPFVSRSGVVVSFDGRLDERERFSSDLSDAACVAAIYDETGERFASQLNGDFALALFDPLRHQLVLACDVMGARRLHYTQVGRTLLFASEIKALLAYPGVSAAPDEDALADVVLDRWIDTRRTCFRGIHSVAPGHMLVATPGTIRLQPHWEFDPTREIRYRTFDEYAECFRTLFEQSVRRRLRSATPVAACVSGGVDSSSIFCQAAALAGREPGIAAIRGISMTFPPGSAADEQRFLNEIETSYGAGIVRLPVSEIRSLRDADRMVGDLEIPELPWDVHTQVYEAARREGCSVLLDGYFGDQVLFPRNYLLDLAHRGRWLTVRRDLREFAAWMTDVEPNFFPRAFWHAFFRSMLPPRLFQLGKRRAARQRAARYAPWYTKAFVTRLLERQLTRFDTHLRFASRHAEECYRNATAGHYLFQVQRQSAAAAMYGVEIAFPFRDRDLVAFLMAIPGDVVNRRGVPKGLLREALGGILPQPIRDRRWKADFTSLTNRAALTDYVAMGQLLTRDSLTVAAGFVDGPLIEEALRNYQTTIEEDESARAGWQLTQVAAFELWMRHFFQQALP